MCVAHGCSRCDPVQLEGQEATQIAAAAAAAVGVNETFDRLIHAYVADLAYLTQSRGHACVCVCVWATIRSPQHLFVLLMAYGRWEATKTFLLMINEKRDREREREGEGQNCMGRQKGHLAAVAIPAWPGYSRRMDACVEMR